ncbi:MAG: ubiquinol-cytochrome C chaperone family protein [Pelagibacteraceae bacterium]|nr:ubiquinol-cytochrome C chaperone family protein [Pelagibacteraceae bacterium]MCI5079234.1 ubiquinol-cytochrome C chaperone family protein [Pelagibacteraceae bacterium]
MDIENLYNKTLTDSRNPDIFKNHILDDLNNKVLIFLIFLSKIFNNISQNDENYQKLFDYIFNRIEIDLRELGYGDMSVNKKMKIIVTKFYSILIDFKNYSEQSNSDKIEKLSKYFSKIEKKDDFIKILNTYFAIDNAKYNDN